MSRRLLSVASGLVAGAAALVLQSPAQAFTITDFSSGPNSADTYWGGLRNGVATTTDIIGDANHFEIFQVDVNRVQVGLNVNLVISISTNYNPSVSGALGTHFGSLFLSTNTIPLAAGHNAADVLTAGRFTHVFDFDGTLSANAKNAVALSNPGANATGNGTATLFQLTGLSDIQASYYDDPPETGPSTQFRQQQAVDYAGNGQAVAGNGTWEFDAASDLLVFTIVGENGLFGDNFGLAWAMTCANDTVIGNVTFPPEVDQPTPIPGALPLFAAGLGLFGFLNHRRKKRTASAA